MTKRLYHTSWFLTTVYKTNFVRVEKHWQNSKLTKKVRQPESAHRKMHNSMLSPNKPIHTTQVCKYRVCIFTVFNAYLCFSWILSSFGTISISHFLIFNNNFKINFVRVEKYWQNSKLTIKKCADRGQRTEKHKPLIVAKQIKIEPETNLS